MKFFYLFAALSLFTNLSFAQKGADTLHYKKVYYFAGTGLALPVGKSKEVLSTKLFAGSMGLDISLKNPKYYVYPALYMFSFGYNQKINDPSYNRMIENGQLSMYMLSLAGGTRRQFERLNTYMYLGPTVGMVSEPRSEVLTDRVKVEYINSFAVGGKLGVGADYKFKGFFLGGEIGYMYHPTKIQGNSFHALTILFGLKSDITKLSSKVVNIIESTVGESPN